MIFKLYQHTARSKHVLLSFVFLSLLSCGGERSKADKEAASTQEQNRSPQADPTSEDLKPLAKKVVCLSDKLPINAKRLLETKAEILETRVPLQTLSNFDSQTSYIKGYYSSLIFEDLILDSDGLPLAYRRDLGRWVRHPVFIAQSLLGLLERNRLDRFELAHQILITLFHEQTNAQYIFYYPFPHYRHRLKYWLQTGWGSAMAQGQFLSILARLYQHFEDDDQRRVQYRDIARKIMRSFSLHECQGGLLQWVCANDSEEDCAPFFAEYTTRFPSYTLNGSVAALAGLAEWADVSSDETAALLFWTGLSGIRKIVFLYDSPPGSHYDLTHLSAQSINTLEPNIARDSYHNFHVSLFTQLFRTTREEGWRCLAERFKDPDRSPNHTYDLCGSYFPDAWNPNEIKELKDFNYGL